VRSFAGEERELLRFQRDQEYEARVLGSVNMLQGMTQPLLHALSELSFFVGLYYGGLLVSQGLLGAAEVITLVQGTQACTGVLTDLFDTLPEIAKAQQPAARICELLERPSPLESSAGVGARPSRFEGEPGSAAAVEFADVHFAYASRKESKVLQGLSFTARSGEVVALVGATGCGKSTIVNLLLRFYAPDSGRVCLHGRPLDEYDVHWLRRQIGVVSQEPLLFGTSIRQNLSYGAPAMDADCRTRLGGSADDDAHLRDTCRLANAWEFIEQLPEGLSTEVGERGVQLSGGQKQRIAIARAILKLPQVLLLDEATSALDVESEQVVQRALDEVIRATSCTTIVIAHRLATIRNADKIVVLHSGVVQEQGSPKELASRCGGAYARLLQVQNGDDPSERPEAGEVLEDNGKLECNGNVKLECNGNGRKLEEADRGLRRRCEAA